jgi:hypothetical protein
VLPEDTSYTEHKEIPKKTTKHSIQFIAKSFPTNPPVKPIATTINFVQNGHSKTNNKSSFEKDFSNKFTKFSSFNFFSCFFD